MKFTFDWLPENTLGQNAHRHWRHKHPDEQNAHQLGKMTVLSKRSRLDPVPEMPVLIVKFHWKSAKNRKDSDNALGMAKHLIDGICKGLGINDRQFVTSMAFQAVDPEKRGFTEVIIRPATKEERTLAA